MKDVNPVSSVSPGSSSPSAALYEAVIGLKLQKEKSKSGIGYSMIVPRLVGQLSEEQGEFVRETYTNNFKRMFAAIPNGATVAADTSTVDAEGPF